MAAPSAAQATKQHTAWYEQMTALAYSHEWVPPVVTVPVLTQPPSDQLSFVPTAPATSASSSAKAPTSATSDSTPAVDLVTASASTSTSTPSTALNVPDITRIVNERVNTGLVAALSAAPVKAPLHRFKLKTFSGTTKDWLDFDCSLTYAMEMIPFMPDMAELKTTTANAVQSSQLRTVINTAFCPCT